MADLLWKHGYQLDHHQLLETQCICIERVSQIEDRKFFPKCWICWYDDGSNFQYRYDQVAISSI